MITSLRQRFQKNPLLGLLCLALILIPVTNSVGQVPLYLASVVWMIGAFRNREPVNRTALLFLLVYAALILAGLLYGVRPDNTVSKLNRFLLFPLVFAVPSALQRGDGLRANLTRLFFAAVLGMTLMAAYDVVRVPWEVHQGTPLFHTGNMTSPQLYMVALFLLMGIKAETRSPKTWAFVLLSLLCVVGMLLHNKRGVWMATLLVFPVWTLWSRQWKNLIFMALVGAFALTLPSVRLRLSELQDVINPNHGGRMVLWREVAPRLFERYPFGMGYNGSQFEDFREVLPRGMHLEIGLKHLHSNPLQTLLELGWHGLAFWSVWMGYYLVKAFRTPPEHLRLLRGATACAFLALLTNGLVEYNFGTSEIFMVYLILFGVLGAFSPDTRPGVPDGA